MERLGRKSAFKVLQIRLIVSFKIVGKALLFNFVVCQNIAQLFLDR